nr:head GIN domain-containing protein [uncultured Flavobacterium sp.]
MKKIFFTLFALCTISISAFAQKIIEGNGNVITENRKTETYDQITLIGSPDVELIQGKEGNLQIQAESNLIPFIETKVENNKLTIKFKDGKSYKTKKGIKVIVPIEDVSKIALRGSGDIYGDHLFTDENLNISVEGSGDISLNINNQNLNAEVMGSGDIKLKGKTNRFNAQVKGSGDIKAKNLNAVSSNLNVNGSGDIESSTSTNVSATVKGSGDIKVYGNPSNVQKDVKGSGDIQIVK